MIAIMWKFEVRDGRENEFEQLFGVEGDWTKMNRTTRSYLGTSFLRNESEPSRYLVIEYSERDARLRAATDLVLRTRSPGSRNAAPRWSPRSNHSAYLRRSTCPTEAVRHGRSGDPPEPRVAPSPEETQPLKKHATVRNTDEHRTNTDEHSGNTKGSTNPADM